MDNLDYQDCYSKEFGNDYAFVYYPIGRDKTLIREIDATNGHGSLIMLRKDKYCSPKQAICLCLYAARRFRLLRQNMLDYRNLLNSMDVKIFHNAFQKKFTRTMNSAPLPSHVLLLCTHLCSQSDSWRSSRRCRARSVS